MGYVHGRPLPAPRFTALQQRPPPTATQLHPPSLLSHPFLTSQWVKGLNSCEPTLVGLPRTGSDLAAAYGISTSVVSWF